MFFVVSRAWDKEKILAPRDESNLRHDTINNPAELARNGP